MPPHQSWQEQRGQPIIVSSRQNPLCWLWTPSFNPTIYLRLSGVILWCLLSLFRAAMTKNPDLPRLSYRKVFYIHIFPQSHLLILFNHWNPFSKSSEIHGQESNSLHLFSQYSFCCLCLLKPGCPPRTLLSLQCSQVMAVFSPIYFGPKGITSNLNLTATFYRLKPYL